MSEKKEYRSAIRSRKLIRQAFKDLLNEKPFEKITVTDVVNKAEINRSTFYAHYPDVMGLLDEIQEEIVTSFGDYLKQVSFSDLLEHPSDYLRLIVEISRQHEDIYRHLSNSTVAIKQMEKMKKMLIRRILSTMDIPEIYRGRYEFEFGVRFFLGGFIDVYTQWLNGDLNCTVDEIIEGVSKLVVQAYNDVNKG